MNGLLLIGGRSSRMGKDKSELIFRDGLTQKERGIELLQSVCDQVYVSINSRSLPSKNTIVDSFGEIGPLGAIASAQQQAPDQAWLVLACDLPLLEESHLKNLAQARSKDHDAVCYTSATDKLPEPLCAIWEASSNAAVMAAIKNKRYCPRDILKNINSSMLPALDLWALANTNTPADSLEVLNRLNEKPSEKTITLSYYAQLREITGTASEQVSTTSVTPAGVFEELRAKYNIQLKRKGMMVAIDGEFSDWTHPIHNGEEIVFIPPVAGG